MQTITTRKQAEIAGANAGALEIDIYYEIANEIDNDGNLRRDDAREAAEQTAGRSWRSDSDGEAAAVLKVPQRWKPVFCAAYAKAARKAAARYLAETAE
jgi:hypothetical protein